MHKQTLGGSIYSGLQKGLHVGQKALEYTALAKGIYETGQQLYTIEGQWHRWQPHCYKYQVHVNVDLG